MKKILIVYATAGIGHKKAALALKQAYDRANDPDVKVTLIDSLDYTTPSFKWSYPRIYLLLITKLIPLWGFFYYLSDNKAVNVLVSRAQRINYHLSTCRLRRYIMQTRPDVVISTHFLASEVMSEMKKQGLTDAKLLTVVTDYRLHAWWVAGCTDMYAVGSQDAKNDLLGWGVPESRIKVLGIPVEPVFTEKTDKNAVLARLGLKQGVFTALVIGGGFGVGPIEDIVKAVSQASGEVQTMVICGHNEKLKEKIRMLSQSLRNKIVPVGFVHNVYDFMGVADILISKSGGITVSESLARELPIIVNAPIPGQETRNSDFLLKHGAAIKVDAPSHITDIINGLLSDPRRVEEVKDAVRRIRKPNAVYDIAALGVQLAGAVAKKV